MELAAAGFETLRSDLEAAINAAAHASSGERLQLAGEAYTAFARRDPALFRLIFGRQGRFDEHPRFRQCADAAFDVLVDCVAAGGGEAPGSPGVMKAAVATWSLVHGYAIRQKQRRERPLGKGQIATAARHLRGDDGQALITREGNHPCQRSGHERRFWPLCWRTYIEETPQLQGYQ
jgi:hypothetical protein